MYHRPYRVVVYDQYDHYRIYHAKSTFADKQRAIDRCWLWVDRGYVAVIKSPEGKTIFMAEHDNSPTGRVITRK